MKKYKWLIFAGYILFTIFVGYLDYITGILPSFSLLYMVPILLASIQFGFPAGIAVAILASLMNAVSEVPFIEEPVKAGFHSFVIDVFFRLIMFLGAVYISRKLTESYQRISALQKSLDADFEIAKVTQRAFFSEITPDVRGIDIGVKLDFSRGIGGDYYDFFQITPSKVGMLVADISGKSISASLFSAVLRANWRNAVRKLEEPNQIVQDMNERLCEELPREMFVTLFCAVLDTGTGEMKFVNAGHEPPILYQGKGKAAFLKNPEPMIVGIERELEFVQQSVVFTPEDVLLIYTDGLTGTKSDEFTEEKIIGLLAEHISDKVQTEADAVYNARFGAEKPADDVTVVCVKRKFAA